MQKNELLNQINVVKGVENASIIQMNERIKEGRETTQNLFSKWQEFFDEYFPEEILNVLLKLPRNGIVLSLENDEYADSLYPMLSSENLHIAKYKDRLIFVKDTMVMGFSLLSRKVNRSPVSFWERTPILEDKIERIDQIETEKKHLESLDRFVVMLEDFKRNIPNIYNEISTAYSELVKNAAENSFIQNEEVEEDKKRYKIIIDLVEI